MSGAGPCCCEAPDLPPGDLGTWEHRSSPSTLEFTEPARASGPPASLTCPPSLLLHSLIHSSPYVFLIRLSLPNAAGPGEDLACHRQAWPPPPQRQPANAPPSTNLCTPVRLHSFRFQNSTNSLLCLCVSDSSLHIKGTFLLLTVFVRDFLTLAGIYAVPLCRRNFFCVPPPGRTCYAQKSWRARITGREKQEWRPES